MINLLFLFLLFLTGCGAYRSSEPTLVSINLIDREGMSETITNDERIKRYVDVDFLAPQPYLKVLRVYKTSNSFLIPAYVTSYHPNGLLKQYLEVINGRANGPYREWYSNGVQKLEAQVIGGTADVTQDAEKSWLFDGLSQVWNEEGGLQAEIPYDKGELSGVSTYYHPNGVVSKRAPFTHNQLNGGYEIYRDDGTLQQMAEYRNGRLEGQAVGYWEDENPSFQELYSDNKLVSGLYFDRRGQCIAKVENGKGWRALSTKEGWELQEFRGGLLEGEVKVIDKQGALVRRYFVKNDLKNGVETYYYPSSHAEQEPFPKLSINWVNANIHGQVKTWYEDGGQESQREMTNNVKNGLLTAWYKDGNLMLIEEYDSGKLIKGKYYRKGEKNPVSKVIGGRGLVTMFDPEGNFQRKIPYQNGSPGE